MRPRVLHVTQATGGVETSLLLLFRYLDQHRFDVHLCCPPLTELGDRARALGIEVFEVPMVRHAHPIRDMIALRRLTSLTKRNRYSIVHGHSAKGGYLARVAARVVGGPKTIYHPRAFSYLSQTGIARKFFLGLERFAVTMTDLVIATSQSEKQRAVKEVGFADERVTVIPNSIDLTEASRWKPERSDSHPLILTVGRFSYQKNPEMFVRMAAEVAARLPQARFAMVGAGFAGPLETQVRRLVEDKGIADRLEILPWTSKDETLRTISRCTVFVLTSRFEGMPNTLLEALMFGKPVVVTDVDGSRDVIEDGVSGYSVPCDDSSAMAGRVVELLEDRQLAKRLGEKGYDHVREFDVHKNVEALHAVYARLAE